MNNTNSEFTVTGLFNDRASAECAYDALTARGYDKDKSDVMMSEETRDRHYSGVNENDTELGSKAAEGTGAGAAIGGTVGAVLAAIAAIGTSVALPGLGLIVAGPIAAALVGAGAGGLTGGLIGALVGSGIPEEHAEAYETGIKSGGIVLRATPDTAEDAAFIESKWKECGGQQVYSNAGQQTTGTSNAGQQTADTATARTVQNTPQQQNTITDNAVIPVIEEKLNVGKRTVETGGVNVKTNVTERQVEENVNLRNEEIHVDRRPADRDATEADLAAVRDGNFTVTEEGEEAVVNKSARVVEEVVINKNVTENTETISDTVKRTDVDVEGLDNKNTK